MIILKWILKTTGNESVDRTDMVQDREESRAIVHIVMKLLDSKKRRKYLGQIRSISISRRSKLTSPSNKLSPRDHSS